MSEETAAHPAGWDEGATGAPSSTAAAAGEQAANVGQSAREAGGQVAGTAAERAKDVAAETRSQARDLVGQAREQARHQVSAQQQRAAGQLRTLADDLDGMAGKAGESGIAAGLARQASSRVHEVAGWLEDHEPAELLDVVRAFARRRPGVFVLAAAAAGVVAGRLTRGVVAAQSGEQQQAPDAAGGGAWDVVPGQPAGRSVTGSAWATAPTQQQESQPLLTETGAGTGEGGAWTAAPGVPPADVTGAEVDPAGASGAGAGGAWTAEPVAPAPRDGDTWAETSPTATYGPGEGQP